MLDNPTRYQGLPAGADPGIVRDADKARLTIPAFLAALRQRRPILAATVILIPLTAWIMLRQVTPLYTASGSLIYEPAVFTLREMQSILRTDPTTDAIMASQAELLQSLHIAQSVAERGNLYTSAEFNPALRRPGTLARLKRSLGDLLGMDTEPIPEQPVYGPTLDRAREQTMMAVRTALHATPIHASHVIEVSFTAQDPLTAAAAVNNAMDVYIKDQYRAKHILVDRASRLLDEQARILRDNVQKLESDVAAYRSRHGLSRGMHASSDSEEITHLTEDLVKARSDLASANGRLDAARGNAGAAALAAISPSVVSLRTQLERLAAQIQSQQTRLGGAHPEAQGLSRQYAEADRALKAETARVIAATEAEQHTAAERVAALEAQFRMAQEEEARTAREEIPLDAMSRDLSAERAQLQAVLERQQQTAQQAAVESSEAHEISQALPPTQPSSPRTVPVMAAASAGGVFLGLMLVYVLHLADSTLRSGDEIRTVTGLPCFARLPEVSRRALGHVTIQDYAARRPLSPFAEQVRALRAGLRFMGANPGRVQPRILAVTAARPAEGKSIVTLALGREAQLRGERVLAIECDLRRPSFIRRLTGRVAPSPPPGLAEILRGDADWRDCVQEDPLTGMGFVPSGRPSGDVLGLFLSERFGALLSGVRAEYDLVLLDAPPAQAMTEARVVAAAADATLLCVRWRSTPRASLLNALELLADAHANVVGAVLTRLDPRTHRRSGYADGEVYHHRYKAYYEG
ncbi:GumC family protein [Rhodopila sp.]|uniref:GumC family protein n=1 Tax=Rhodopila sp. TaxID=2480087 RepID=UPI002C9B31EC|nr:hypothetical protein [Rhodopila sp.]HVZ08232.1 hypothetical protein [Rhodopila sp.]